MVLELRARRRRLGEASGSLRRLGRLDSFVLLSLSRFLYRSFFRRPFLWLGRGFENRGVRAVAMRRSERFAGVITAQLVGFVFVDRAGMGNFFSDTEFVQLVDDLARLYFELPRELIDSNLTHI
jgi:hypothetical protein